MNKYMNKFSLEVWKNPRLAATMSPLGLVMYKAYQHFKHLDTMRRGFLSRVYSYINEYIKECSMVPAEFSLYVECWKEWEESWLQRPEIQIKMYNLLMLIYHARKKTNAVTLQMFLKRLSSLNKSASERVKLYEILKVCYAENEEVLKSDHTSDFMDDFVIYVCMEEMMEHLD